MVDKIELLRVLDRLESRESELITWGDTGGYFTLAEFDELLAETLPHHDPEDVEDELRRQIMIVPVLDARDMEIGVRTRMAEAMHLYRNLRQWFIGKNLEQASTLVSDYRFIRNRRKYPRRDLPISPLIERWQSTFLTHSATKQGLKDLVGSFNLSGFQARATERILAAWGEHQSSQRESSATIVCAGTGSGKTMAFYLPALSALATDIQKSGEQRVRILAVYPRKELLKDQFNETWHEARKLDAQLANAGARKIRIGAFFGDTRKSPADALQKLGDSNESLNFSLLKCISDGCGGQMRWAKSDMRTRHERLKCNICGYSVTDEEVVLTRFAMADAPPDILFTTTEMLNQRMSDARLRHLFGIGVDQALPLVLLDEVHTYGGSQGAQTGLLLRRWMQLSGNRPHFVGLSATLRDAENFFSTLTGTPRAKVTLVEPLAEEMEEEGAEYLLALRGDPVSQTALLSTTIQGAMLTRRILDNSQYRKSEGTWGTKTFIFTDDLDVSNRLFTALADAEGWWQRGGGLRPNQQGPLAQLRNSSSIDTPRRTLLAFGQDWAVAKASGFTLDADDRARVSRTSSQDEGFNRNAEVVVTTASLEVGFNDPDVGAVIQHKAPRGVASYLQRKGRAGRKRSMRPWMLIVLSDYGRDRIAYQQYENLIDPEVNVQNLPIDNGHILKMQAALAVLDWLSDKFDRGHIWNWLNNPDNNQEALKKLQGFVDKVLLPGQDQERLSDYIKSALVLDDIALNRVLWQAPRSIFLEFLPTLQRRLSSHWGAWSDAESQTVEWLEKMPTWGSPVPEFIPASSFADLNAPDLRIGLHRRGETQWESMGFFQGLKEFAPGRISKRFAVATGSISDWLVPNDYQPLPQDDVVDFEIGEAFGAGAGLVAGISPDDSSDVLNIYQPCRLTPATLFADKTISDTSNSFLRWKTEFVSPEDCAVYDIPDASSWSGMLGKISFYTHGMMSPLELIRYTTGADAQIKFKDGRAANAEFNWVHEGNPVAIGARLFVDAVRLDFSVTDDSFNTWFSEDAVSRALRLELFQDKVQQDVVFGGNKFQADWVFECFIAALVLEVNKSSCSLGDAIGRVCDGTSVVPLEDLPLYLFQLDEKAESAEDGEVEEGAADKEQKLQRELKSLLAAVEVRNALRTQSDCLHLPLADIADIHQWVRAVLANTLAAAFQQALCVLLPNVDERSVIVDTELSGDSTDQFRVWISEVESGGLGVISQLQDQFASDPIKVLSVFSRCLQPGDYEQSDIDLYQMVQELAEHDELAGSVAAFRAASGYQDRLQANQNLRSMLSARGFLVSHTLATVMHSRILRPGSNVQTDQSLLEHLENWKLVEKQCGLEIPVNIIAVALALRELPAGDPFKVFERACAIHSVLWVRGGAIRQASLNFYNQFQPGNARTERIIGARVCPDRSPLVRYEEGTWLADVHAALDSSGQVDLSLERDQVSVLPKVIASLHVNPLDTHGLLFYPRLNSISQVGEEYRLRIELAEVLH